MLASFHLPPPTPASTEHKHTRTEHAVLHPGICPFKDELRSLSCLPASPFISLSLSLSLSHTHTHNQQTAQANTWPSPWVLSSPAIHSEKRNFFSSRPHPRSVSGHFLSFLLIVFCAAVSNFPEGNARPTAATKECDLPVTADEDICTRFVC